MSAKTFDAASVRRAWDSAADIYAEGQARGRDHYRYDYFGPAQVAVCGDVAGLRVLDVGSGAGYLARELAQRGARVVGVDISSRMVAHAKSLEAREALGIEYHVGDAAELDAMLEERSFDMAVSCVALQDMPATPQVFRAVHRVLRSGGRFVASITHPCGDMPYREWELDASGRKRWLCLDRYFDRGPIEYVWKGWGRAFTTAALHAPLEDWFGWILDAGFRIAGFREPVPSAAALAAHPDLEDATRMPYFVIFDLVKA
jgi:ubiquinone/menaquinone biosynthesis C-methylase UbiE